MGAIRDQANQVYADGPAGVPTEPIKSDIRSLFGTVEAAIDGASAGAVQVATWAELAAITGDREGQPGRTSLADGGTHTDPVVGGTVDNAGEYSWSESPAGWRRIADLFDPSGLGGLATKDTVGESDIGNGAVTTDKLDDDAVTSEKLASTFSYRGTIGGTDMNALVETGVYVVTAEMSNDPFGAMVGAIVEVETQGSYTVQTYRSFTDPMHGWSRVIRPSIPTYSDWVPFGSGREVMAQRGTIPTSTSLNDVVAPGTYLGSGANTYTFLPAELAPGSGFFLTCETPGANSATGIGASRYVKQTIVSFVGGSFYRKAWERTLDTQSPPSSDTWTPRYKVIPEMLIAGYDYRGAIGTAPAETNLNNVVSTGAYVITAAMTNGPSGAPAGALLRVDNHGSFIVQTFTSTTDPTVGWKRIIRPSSSIYGVWVAFNLAGGGGGAGGSHLAGKKIVCFGDSITENGDYPTRLAARTGATVVKAGFGGCRMAEHDHATVGVYYDPFSMYQLAARIENDDWTVLTDAADALYAYNGDDNRPQAAELAAIDWNTVDYIVIFYGTNDFTGDVPIGTASDSDGTTFMGAVNVTIDSILSTYPHIRIMFVTPMWRAIAETPNGNTNVLTDFVDAVIERAQAHNVEAFDLYHACGINTLTNTTYLADGTHPTSPVGYQLVADKIGAALEARF